MENYRTGYVPNVSERIGRSVPVAPSPFSGYFSRMQTAMLVAGKSSVARIDIADEGEKLWGMEFEASGFTGPKYTYWFRGLLLPDGFPEFYTNWELYAGKVYKMDDKYLITSDLSNQIRIVRLNKNLKNVSGYLRFNLEFMCTRTGSATTTLTAKFDPIRI